MIDKNYKYNEIEYAKLIYNRGFQTNHIPTELKLVATYMKEVLNLKPKERKKCLYEFCEKWFPNYNRAKHFGLINSALYQSAKKGQKLINIEKVNVYQDEFDYINLLDIDNNFKKVLFTFLIQMKLNKIIYEYRNEKPYTSIYFKGGKTKYSNIKSISNIHTKLDINDDVIYFLAQKNLITILHKGLIVLNFLENCFEAGKVIMEITDYENIGLYFEMCNNNSKVRMCKYCNKPFVRNKNNIEYCSMHKGYQPIVTKIIKCIDCGKEFEVDSLDNQTIRCTICYKVYRKNKIKENVRNYRKNKM